MNQLKDFWKPGPQTVSNKVLEDVLRAALMPVPDISFLTENDYSDVWNASVKKQKDFPKERYAIMYGLVLLLIELHAHGEVESDMNESLKEEIPHQYSSLHSCFQ